MKKESNPYPPVGMIKPPPPPPPPPMRRIMEGVGIIGDCGTGGGFSNLLCRIFGHKFYLYTSDVSLPKVCVRCGFETPGIVWPRK